MDKTLDLKAFHLEGGVKRPVTITVENPVLSQDGDRVHYFCQVHMLGVFDRGFRITGVDEQHAKKNAFLFLRTYWNGLDKKLVDSEGKLIQCFEQLE